MSVARNILLDAEKKFPLNPALSIGANEYSYHVFLSSLTRAFDHKLVGAFSYNAIAVLADKTLDGYRAIAAGYLSGRMVVPLNVQYPISRNLNILEQSNASALFVESGQLKLAQELNDALDRKLDIYAFSHDENYELEMDIYNSEWNPSTELEKSIAYLLFTSGSTGEPKGVPITHNNLKAYLTNIPTVFHFLETDRFSQFFSFTFDLSIHDMLVCWMHGACLCVADQTALLMPLHFAQRQRITVWFSVPSLALVGKDLLRDKFESFKLPEIRCSLFCGEALPKSLALQWKMMTEAPVINLYGPTEATIAFTAYELDELDDTNDTVPIGRPFGNNRAAILDSDGVISDNGELCLSGEQVFAGYWQCPGLDEDSFHVDNAGINHVRWYRSGDLVSQVGNSPYIFHGRRDRQVQLGGYRVELQEVEHVLRRFTRAGTVAVIAHPISENAIGATRLIAFVCNSNHSPDELKKLCSKELPAYMIPHKIIALSKFPYNASGKLDYKQLRKSIDQL